MLGFGFRKEKRIEGLEDIVVYFSGEVVSVLGYGFVFFLFRRVWGSVSRDFENF